MAVSPPSFRKDKVPYRVIDVDATLLSNGGFRFCTADSISDFCVVSHKWNDHVVALMTEIQEAAVTEKLSYPQAVTNKNWAHVNTTKKVYRSIKEFLEVLQVQGVKKMWMDTLCIDQSETSTEKTREIPLMGPYYRHSSACYVPINGFGFNYQLKMGQPVTEMEWLNRVWTLQEFLLPDKVYFLVEVEPWMENWLALRVATAGKDLSHFCSCCVGEFSFMLEALRMMSKDMEGVTFEVEKIKEADITHTCQYCGQPPLLRRAFTNKEEKLYLVQREAIFAVALLAQFHTRVQTNSWEETREQQRKRFDEVFALIKRNEWLLRVMHVRKEGGWFSSFEILSEICERQCTVEQDRILGVLGLLGVKAAQQDQEEEKAALPLKAAQQDQEEEKAALPFTAKTAEKQLVELASSGQFTEQLLVELCWMDRHSGRNEPQMSWVPDFTGEVSSDGISTFLYKDKTKKYHSMATSVRVAPEGPLTLTVKVLKGYVTCLNPKNLSWQATEHAMGEDSCLHFQHNSLVYRNSKDDNESPLFSFSRQFGHSEVQRFNKELVDMIDREDRAFGGHDGTLELTFNEHGSFSLPFKHPAPFKGFEMWLLYLGHYRGKGTVLLCLHKRGAASEVHKIGTLHASYMGMRRVLDDIKDPSQVVTIAGYGKYLDGHVDLK